MDELTDLHSPTDRDIIIVGLALLLHVGQADKEFTSEELAQLVAGMSVHFGTADTEVGALLETAEFLSRDKAKFQSLVEQVNDRLDVEQRQALVTTAWRVIATDGTVRLEEGLFARELRTLLNLTPEQAAYACSRANQEIAAFRERQSKIARDSEYSDSENEE